MTGALLVTDATLATCELPPILPPWHGPDFESAWPLSWRPDLHIHVEVPEDPWHEAQATDPRDLDYDEDGWPEQ